VVAVVGTGTGVGKTHATRALATALADERQSVAALKPVESGVGSGPSDYGQLAAASTFHVKPPPYALPHPVSPHLAARLAGRSIRLPRIVAWVRGHDAAWVLVETAGALLSPLRATATNLDLVQALRPQAVILVAVDRLGVLHDVRATLLALRTAVEAPVVLVLQPPRSPDASTGTNARELLRLGIAPSVVSFPRTARLRSPALHAAASQLLRVVERAVQRAPRR
jgi:dethiobiotin synthetase